MPMSHYMKALREKVGTQLLEVPSVAVLVRDASDRILLARHTEGDAWVPPGGAVEPLETPADAAVRETWEETGLFVELVRISGVYGGPEFVVTYANGDSNSYLMVAFEAEVVAGTPRPDRIETLEVGYFATHEIDRLRVPAWLSMILADALQDEPRAGFRAPTWTPDEIG